MQCAVLVVAAAAIAIILQGTGSDAAIIPCNSSLLWLNITSNHSNDIRLLNCDIPKLRISITGTNVSLFLIDVSIASISIGRPPDRGDESSTSQVQNVRLVIRDSNIVPVDVWPLSSSIVSWSQSVSNLSILVSNSRLSGGISGAVDIRSQTSTNVQVQVDGSVLQANCTAGMMPHSTFIPSVVALVAAVGAVNTTLWCQRSSLRLALDNGTVGWGHHTAFASVLHFGSFHRGNVTVEASTLHTVSSAPPSSTSWGTGPNATAAACLRCNGLLNGSTVTFVAVDCRGPRMMHVVALAPGASLVHTSLLFLGTSWILNGLGACIALLPTVAPNESTCAFPSNGTVVMVTLRVEDARGQWVAPDALSTVMWPTRLVRAEGGVQLPTVSVLVDGASNGLHDTTVIIRCSSFLMDLGATDGRPTMAVSTPNPNQQCSTLLHQVLIAFVAIPYATHASTFMVEQSRFIATAATANASIAANHNTSAAWSFGTFVIAPTVYNVTLSVQQVKVQLPLLTAGLNASNVLDAPYNDTATHAMMSCVFASRQSDGDENGGQVQRVVSDAVLGPNLPRSPAANVSLVLAGPCIDEGSRCFPSASQRLSTTQSEDSPSRSRSSASGSISRSGSLSRKSVSASRSVTLPNVSASVVGSPLFAAQLLNTKATFSIFLRGTRFNTPLLQTVMCTTIRFAPMYHVYGGGSINGSSPKAPMTPGSTSLVAMRVGRFIEEAATLGPSPQGTEHWSQVVVPANATLFRNVDTEDLALWFSIAPHCTARADLTLYFMLTVDRIPPYRLSSPTYEERIVQDGALAAAVVGLAPWIAAEVARVATPLTVLDCTVSPSTVPLRHYQSFVGWSLTEGMRDDGVLGFYVGAVVINVSVWVGCLLLHVLVVVLYQCISYTTLLKGCIEARFPSLLIVPVLALLQPTVMASIVLVTEGHVDDTLWIGVAGCAVCVVVCLSMTVRHMCTFTCVYDPDAYRPHRTFAGRCLMGVGLWRDHPEERVLHYAKRHGLWFGPYRATWHWVFIIELWTSVFFGVIEGVKLGEASCVPLIWALGVVFLGRALFFAIAHPFDAVFMNAVASAIAALEACLCASLIAHEWLDLLNIGARATANDVAEWTVSICVYAVAACAVVAILCSVWRACASPVRDSGGTTSQSDAAVLSHLPPSMLHDSAHVLKLVERINEDVAQHRDAYDPTIRTALVNAHLELLLPGCEREAEVSLMTLMTEIDVMALEGGRKKLFTAAMEELFVLLASKHQETLAHGGQQHEKIAVELSPTVEVSPVSTTHRTMRQPPPTLLLVSDDPEFSPTSLDDVELLAVDQQQLVQDAFPPIPLEERRQFLDDVLQDQPRLRLFS